MQQFSIKFQSSIIFLLNQILILYKILRRPIFGARLYYLRMCFQTAATSTEGMFQIHAKFMGVRLEHVDIDIQDLLQLQYEGVSVMNVFGKAKINVNLLLYLLNTKFYTRKRRWMTIQKKVFQNSIEGSNN